MLAYNNEHMHTLRLSVSVTLILTVGVTRFLVLEIVPMAVAVACASQFGATSPLPSLVATTGDVWCGKRAGWDEGLLTVASEAVLLVAAFVYNDWLSNLRHSNKMSQNSLLEYKQMSVLFAATKADV